jgi:hypothetical protein
MPLFMDAYFVPLHDEADSSEIGCEAYSAEEKQENDHAGSSPQQPRRFAVVVASASVSGNRREGVAAELSIDPK